MPDVLPQLRHPTAYDMQRALLHAPQLSSRDYRHITVAPVSGAIGAEVTGIALAAHDDSAMGEVVTALADLLVLVFPGQTLAPADQVAFARRLGPVNPWPYARPMAAVHYGGSRREWPSINPVGYSADKDAESFLRRFPAAFPDSTMRNLGRFSAETSF